MSTDGSCVIESAGELFILNRVHLKIICVPGGSEMSLFYN